MIKQIHKLIKMQEEVKVVHSYRQANSCANALVKAGIDSMHEMVFRDNASDFTKSMVDLDAKWTLFPRLAVYFFLGD